MPVILENPLEHLLALLHSKTGRIVLGLVGLPGSGKTTLTQEWERQINLREGAGVAKALSHAVTAFRQQVAKSLARAGEPDHINHGVSVAKAKRYAAVLVRQNAFFV